MIAAAETGRTPAVGQGASMAPVYGENTMLVISQVNYDDLQPGMIVAYRNARGFQVVHRLLEKSPQGWIAMGINNDEIDRERVTRDNLIGVIYASLVHELDTEP